MKCTSLTYYIVLGWGTLESRVADYVILWTILYDLIF
jgi:hypothetical protein